MSIPNARTSRRRRASLPACVALALLAPCPALAAKGPAKGALDPDWASAPSARYAALDRAGCLGELKRRSIPFAPLDEARGVVTPVRVVDGVGGVLYRTAQSREKRLTSPHDVFDCRLVLALDDLSVILRGYDIDEVLMFSGWRPPPKSWPADEPAPRHPGAMAIDVFRFGRWVQPAKPDAPEPPEAPVGKQPASPDPSKPPADEEPASPKPPDGAAAVDSAAEEPTAPSTAPATKPPPEQASGAAASPKPSKATRTREWLDVKEHFQGKIGEPTCGAEVPGEKLSPEARLLRSIVCEAGDKKLFTTILTPNYNAEHHNHVHLDLIPGARWRLVR